MFLKKHFTIIGLACVLSVPVVDAGAEGFAINEWSAEGVAMGGARMFAENDAANIATIRRRSPKCGAKLLNRVRFISAAWQIYGL